MLLCVISSLFLPEKDESKSRGARMPRRAV
jgi:hypothetical protein